MPFYIGIELKCENLKISCHLKKIWFDRKMFDSDHQKDIIEIFPKKVVTVQKGGFKETLCP